MFLFLRKLGRSQLLCASNKGILPLSNGLLIAHLRYVQLFTRLPPLTQKLSPFCVNWTLKVQYILYYKMDIQDKLLRRAGTFVVLPKLL